MRRSRTDLRARVNGDLQLEFTDIALTSYAGLELFGRYLRATGFNATVRAACAGTPGWGDFGAVAMVRVVINVDGVVVSTGLQVERAFRGFNPHHRKVPSYYPIMAHPRDRPPHGSEKRWRMSAELLSHQG